MITEAEIRNFIKARAERFVGKYNHETSMIEELEVENGEARIDMAFISSYTLGIEIKSPKDNLSRLPKQSSAFSRYFDYIILITDEKFVLEAEKIIPSWWGITSIKKRGDHIYFHQNRRSQRNLNLNLESLISLLWKDELLSLVSSSLGVKPNPKKPKRELRKQLLETEDIETLKKNSFSTIMQRSNWRSTLFKASA